MMVRRGYRVLRWDHCSGLLHLQEYHIPPMVQGVDVYSCMEMYRCA